MDTHAKQHSQEERKDHDEGLKALNAASLAGVRRVTLYYPGLELFRGSLTTSGADCLVNAANEGLQGGGGVDGHLHALAAGCASAGEHQPSGCPLCAEIQERFPADAVGARLATGSAVTTRAYGVPGARVMVHTVGPYLDEQGSPQPALLAACYKSSLREAYAAGAQVVAFPAISTGYYGYPMAAAGQVAVEAVTAYFEEAAASGGAAAAWRPRVLLTALSQLQGDILEALLGGTGEGVQQTAGGAAAGGAAP